MVLDASDGAVVAYQIQAKIRELYPTYLQCYRRGGMGDGEYYLPYDIKAIKEANHRSLPVGSG